MRGEWVDAAYVFDGFIASRMDVMHRAMRAQLRAMAEELGIPAKHLELVMIIASAEADTAGEIARQLGVSRSLLSKNVEEAVRAGYIETAQDPADRRVVRLRLTPQAQAAAERCKTMREDFYRDICAGIDGEALDVFLHVMQRIWKNIEGITARAESAAVRGKGDG